MIISENILCRLWGWILGRASSGYGPMVSCCDDGVEFSGSITTNVAQHFSACWSSFKNWFSAFNSVKSFFFSAFWHVFFYQQQAYICQNVHFLAIITHHRDRQYSLPRSVVDMRIANVAATRVPLMNWMRDITFLISSKQNDTVGKRDNLESRFILIGTKDTSLKNGKIPLKTGYLVTLP